MSLSERYNGLNSSETVWGLAQQMADIAVMDKKEIRIKVPPKAQYIIDTITAAGYEAYVVGGCVRDSVLGRKPQDWDITTSAKPDQVKKLFFRTIDTGLKHGTVTVILERECFEVTTYRIDGKYEDSRHPKEVRFTPNLEEDLKRRDFTVNAMAYNEERGLVDIFGGMEDIRTGVIRCVGDPLERFNEDALRMLRAIRFSAQLGYVIDDATREGIRCLAPTLKNISAERIQTELVKLLVSSNPDYLRAAYELGVTKVFFPEFDIAMETEQKHPHHKYSVGEHTLHSLKSVKPDKKMRLAMLLHDIGKPATLTIDAEGVTHFHDHPAVSEKMAKEFLHRLKFDNDTLHTVCKLILYHDYGNGLEPNMRIVRRAVNKIGEEAFPALFEIKRADVLAQSDYLQKEKLELIDRWQQLYEEMREQKQCVSLKDLAVTGTDLIEAGWEPGKELGEVLKKLLEFVLEQPDCNTKEILLAEAVKYREKP